MRHIPTVVCLQCVFGFHVVQLRGGHSNQNPRYTPKRVFPYVYTAYLSLIILFDSYQNPRWTRKPCVPLLYVYTPYYLQSFQFSRGLLI